MFHYEIGYLVFYALLILILFQEPVSLEIISRWKFRNNKHPPLNYVKPPNYTLVNELPYDSKLTFYPSAITTPTQYEFTGSTGENYFPHTEYDEASCLVHTISLLELNNVLINVNGLVSDGKSIFSYTLPSGPSTPSKQINLFNTTICISYEYINNYGHFLIDFIGSLVALPSYLLENSTFLIPKLKEDRLNLVYALGIIPENVIYGTTNDIFFVRKLYIYHQYNYQMKMCSMINKIREKLKKIYNLDKKPPTKYYFHTRATKNRVYLNADQLFEMLKTVFFGLNWVHIKDIQTLKESAEAYNDALLSIFISGAGVTNAIFQQEGTVLCQFILSKIDFFFPKMTRSLGLYHILGRLPYMDYYMAARQETSTTILTNLVRPGVEYIKNSYLK